MQTLKGIITDKKLLAWLRSRFCPWRYASLFGDVTKNNRLHSWRVH